MYHNPWASSLCLYCTHKVIYFLLTMNIVHSPQHSYVENTVQYSTCDSVHYSSKSKYYIIFFWDLVCGEPSMTCSLLQSITHDLFHNLLHMSGSTLSHTTGSTICYMPGFSTCLSMTGFAVCHVWLVLQSVIYDWFCSLSHTGLVPQFVTHDWFVILTQDWFHSYVTDDFFHRLLYGFRWYFSKQLREQRNASHGAMTLPRWSMAVTSEVTWRRSRVVK